MTGVGPFWILCMSLLNVTSLTCNSILCYSVHLFKICSELKLYRELGSVATIGWESEIESVSGVKLRGAAVSVFEFTFCIGPKGRVQNKCKTVVFDHIPLTPLPQACVVFL